MKTIPRISTAAFGIVFVLGMVMWGGRGEAKGNSGWPASDQRLDVAHGYRISLSDANYDHVSDRIPMILSWNIENLLRVEEARPGQYQNVFYDRRWGRTSDYIVPISTNQLNFILSYNPNYLTYTQSIDSAEHYELFSEFFRNQNPGTILGTYISATTCVDDPQSPANLMGAGNTYPATVLDCCAITPNCHDDFANSAPFTSLDDGRWYLPFDDANKIDAALTVLENTLATQHDSAHLFLDNGRYITAHWQDAANCQNAYMTCTNTCNGNAACVADCDRTIIHTPACQDRRQTTPHIPNPAYPGFTIWSEDLYQYYAKLMKTINGAGYRGVLNTSVLPALMGNYIEQPYLRMYENAVDTNGIGFEQAWHRSVRVSPKYVEQEIHTNQRFLAQNKLVIHYPSYHHPGEQLWSAAMALSIKERGQSLFLVRSPYDPTPVWAHWPALYGKPLGDAVSVQTTCIDCLQKRGGYVGDWFITRQFARGRVTASSLNLTIDIQKAEGSTLDPSDVAAATVDLAGLLGQDLTLFDYLFHPAQFGTWTSSDGRYTAAFSPIAADFTAAHGTPIHFPAGTNVIEHKMDDYFGIGIGCNQQLCRDLIMTAVQLTLRITKHVP
jgi:hypothetical protein